MASQAPQARNHQQLWVRADGELPDDPLLHAAVVAYASDMSIIDSILKPHEIAWEAGASMVASLDHCMWFHRPFRADRWLLFDQDSPDCLRCARARAGPAVRRGGHLVVSLVQEGLVRVQTRYRQSLKSPD